MKLFAFVIIVALLAIALIAGHGNGYKQPDKPAVRCLSHVKTCDLRNY